MSRFTTSITSRGSSAASCTVSYLVDGVLGCSGGVGPAVDSRSRAGTVNSLTFLAANSIPWANSKAVLNDNSFSESKRRWIMVSHTMRSRSIVSSVSLKLQDLAMDWSSETNAVTDLPGLQNLV